MSDSSMSLDIRIPVPDMIRIELVNIGPFKKASIELKPLTIFIGRNNAGKSLIAQLIWVLAETIPDAYTVASLTYKELTAKFKGDPVEVAYKKISGGSADAIGVLTTLIKNFIEAFGEGIVHGFKREAERIFGNLSNLVKVGENYAEINIISISGDNIISQIDLVIENNNIKLNYYKPNIEYLNNLSISLPYPKHLRISYQNIDIYNDVVTSEGEIIKGIIPMIYYYYTFTSFFPLFSSASNVFLPDSRAGVSRILLRPYPRIEFIREIHGIEAKFIDEFHELIRVLESRSFIRGSEDLLSSILEEFGCKVRLVREAGVYTIYLDFQSGKTLHISMAPSGIREALMPILALVSNQHNFVIIEEPEAHLHPRVQRLLARLVARAVNSGKYIVITTHSDYIVSQLDNLVRLSSKSREDIEKLGFRESDALKPENVSVYLFRISGRESYAEKLSVSEEGIPQEEFSKVVNELLEERARIEIV
jgi:hypothetical protein